MSAVNDCIFCKIVKKEIPAKIIFENKDCIAFPDINPKARVHILIVPKEHQEGLSALRDSDQGLLGRLMLVVPQVARKMQLDSFRIIINSGKGAGQTVFHLHLHLVSPDGVVA